MMVKYAIDFSNSTIAFSIKHMMISDVLGSFDSFSGNIEADSIENLSNANINIEIDVASVSTKDYERDKHLTSAEFFHSDRYPKITFMATNIVNVGNNTYHIVGELTIKNVTKQVIFDTKYTGHIQSQWGHDTFVFNANTQINRREFNLLYNEILETGGFLIGENVGVFIELGLHRI